MEQIGPGKFKHPNGIVDKVDVRGERLDHKDPDTGAAYSEHYKDGDLWRATCVSHMQVRQLFDKPVPRRIREVFPTKEKAKTFLDGASKLPGAIPMEDSQLPLDGERQEMQEIRKKYFNLD